MSLKLALNLSLNPSILNVYCIGPKALKEEEVQLRDYCWTAQEEVVKETLGAWEAEGPKQYVNLLENIQEAGQDLAGALRKLHEKQDIVQHQKDLMMGHAGEYR